MRSFYILLPVLSLLSLGVNADTLAARSQMYRSHHARQIHSADFSTGSVSEMEANPPADSPSSSPGSSPAFERRSDDASREFAGHYRRGVVSTLGDETKSGLNTDKNTANQLASMTSGAVNGKSEAVEKDPIMIAEIIDSGAEKGANDITDTVSKRDYFATGAHQRPEHELRQTEQGDIASFYLGQRFEHSGYEKAADGLLNTVVQSRSGTVGARQLPASLPSSPPLPVSASVLPPGVPALPVSTPDLPPALPVPTPGLPPANKRAPIEHPQTITASSTSRDLSGVTADLRRADSPEYAPSALDTTPRMVKVKLNRKDNFLD